MNENTTVNRKDLNEIDKCVNHTLDLLKLEKGFGLDGFTLAKLRVDRIEDYTRNILLYSLHTLIPAENMKEETHTVTVEYPKTWWQMFKEQYFSSWLKAKYPVKYRKTTETVKFIAYNVYPKFPSFMAEQCKGAVQIIHKSTTREGGIKDEN